MAITDSLLGYWKLDETSGTSVADSHSTNTGTSSGVTFTTGKINGAYDFAPTDYTTLTTLGNFGQSWESGFTISLWLKTTTTTFGTFLLGTANNDDNQKFEVLLNAAYTSANDQDKIFFYLNDDAGGGAVYGGTTNDEPTWRDGNWNHIVFTYDGNQTIQLLINNSSKALTYGAQSDQGTWINLDNAFTIGARNDKGIIKNHATVTIDEVGVWNRVLSAGEITTLYNGGSGLTYPFSTRTPRRQAYTI